MEGPSRGSVVQVKARYRKKDLRLALETAAELSLPLEIAGHLKNIYDQGIAAGWSEDDSNGLIRHLDKKA